MASIYKTDDDAYISDINNPLAVGIEPIELFEGNKQDYLLEEQLMGNSYDLSPVATI
jgi:hypothetical protein